MREEIPGYIKVTYDEKENGWWYEHLDIFGNHKGNLDILFRFNDGEFEALLDKSKLFISDNVARGMDLKIDGYIIRPHTDTMPFIWH